MAAPPLSRWRLVLASPATPENIGACARLAGNFGLAGISVVAPRFRIDGQPGALRLAVNAERILADREEHPDLASALAETRFSLALSMRGGAAQRFDLESWSPAPLLPRIPADGPCALVLGREDNGLLLEERALCSALWALPADAACPSLNVAQAAAVALAGLAAAFEGEPSAPPAEPPAEHQAVESMLEHLGATLRLADYERGAPLDGPIGQIRRLAARAGITDAEVRLVRGFCRRIANALEARSPK